MEKFVKVIFLVYSINTLLFGLPLFLMPGRFLGLFGWAPVDPLISRVLGAALLAMAWCAFRGYLAYEPDQAKMLVSGNLVFTALGAAGLLRHLLGYYFPFMVWFVFGLLALWTIVWAVIAFRWRHSI
jgi:hypothetical protein